MRRWSVESSEHGCDGGFTLLEFLVSFTILSLFVAVLMTAVSGAMKADNQALFMTRATTIARAKLAAAGIDYPLQPGAMTGTSDHGYVWRATIRRVRAQTAGLQAYWVEVAVSNPALHGSRALNLASIELDPRARQ